MLLGVTQRGVVVRSSRGSAFVWVILGLLIVTLVYLMVDVGSAKDVFKQYESVKGGKSSSFSRRTVFLNSYIEATGDLSIASSLGLSTEEMQGLGGNKKKNTGGNQPPINWGTDLQAAIDKYKSSHISNMTKAVSCGIEYPMDNQTGMMTANGSGTSLSQGCMFFSCAVAASVVRREVIGVDVLIQNAGHKTSKDSKGLVISPKLPKVGLNSGSSYSNGKPCTPTGLLSGLCTVGKDYGKSMSYDQSFINSGGVYLAHVAGDTSHKYSYGVEHWFVIAGKNYDGSYIILNGAGSNGKNGKFYDSDKGLLNHWMEVSK